MRVVLIGAGVVGFHLAEQLSEEGHDISVVDSDPKLVRRLDDKFDVLAVAGDASLPSVLSRAGVEDADLVVAVTNRDTTNIVVSLVARKLGAKKSIVRVRNREFSANAGILSRDDISADVVINPIETTVDLLRRLVKNPGATDVAEFAGGELLLWGFIVSPSSPLVGLKLKHLRDHADEIHALVVAIARTDGSLVIPGGEDEIGAGDNIYVFLHRKATRGFRKLVNPDEQQVGSRLVIGGASQLGIELAQRLEGRSKNIVLVEADRELAEQASSQVSRTMVLCGEFGDPDFAKEYGENVDYFLAVSDDDQANLMNALMAKKQGAKRVAVLAQQPQFLPVLRSLDLGVVVNPRLLTVSAILRHIRRGHILQVSRIGDFGAEAREYALPEHSPLVGKAIKDASFPTGTILGAIFRGDNYIIPSGDTVLAAEDHVVIFALPEAVVLVEKLFSKKKLFNR